MSRAVWFLGRGDTGPILRGTLERQVSIDPEEWEAEDLTGCTVTLSLFKADGKTYKSGVAMTIETAEGTGRVSYAWAAADSLQGLLTGKACVTYPDTRTISFPNDGHFQIRVSR